MKTINELYNEVVVNDQLKQELADAAQENKVIEFFAVHGVDTTAEEVSEYLHRLYPTTPELTDDELDAVAGGEITSREFFLSVFLSMFHCAITHLDV